MEMLCLIWCKVAFWPIFLVTFELVTIVWRPDFAEACAIFSIDFTVDAGRWHGTELAHLRHCQNINLVKNIF
jgi:hypothetical protein